MVISDDGREWHHHKTITENYEATIFSDGNWNTFCHINMSAWTLWNSDDRLTVFHYY